MCVCVCCVCLWVCVVRVRLDVCAPPHNTPSTHAARQHSKAAHFLVGYLLGLPLTGYSLAMTKEHVEFAEAKLQARIITRDLAEDEVDALAAVSVAGEPSRFERG